MGFDAKVAEVREDVEGLDQVGIIVKRMRILLQEGGGYVDRRLSPTLAKSSGEGGMNGIPQLKAVRGVACEKCNLLAKERSLLVDLPNQQNPMGG